MKSTYKRKLFVYFFIVFIVFTIVITVFQYNRKKEYKTNQLESVLNDYTDFVFSYIINNELYNSKEYAKLDSFIQILPRKDIRITVIDHNGEVLYDSYYEKYWELENHKNRPEIQKALYSESGSSKRASVSTGQNYYYYAKLKKDFFVRAAVIYSINIQEFLKAENIFIYFIIGIFIIMIVTLISLSDRIGKSILKLKDFAVRAGNNKSFDTNVSFPGNELGVIGKQIITIYNNLKRVNMELNNEREKLIHHLQMSQEGIAIFSSSHEKILANNHFIQYLNIISDIPAINPDHVHDIKELKPISKFIETHLRDNKEFSDNHYPIKKISIHKNKLYFEVQCIVFHDKSYEISIIDITKVEKRKRMKQQMTSNIAHELRTPVTSIKGYLETILSNDDIPHEKQLYFIERANTQIDRLSELIRDISIITKIEEAANLYKVEEIDLGIIVKDVIENLQSKIDPSKAKVVINIGDNTKIHGNTELLYSIFQNLLENTLLYGGEEITINIDKYLEDENHVFFSFSDNGVGIKEEHQNRIFERFYRVDQGRARKYGGTGLGLAIVKNAIQFHQGDISVKTKKGGGAEFLFSLAK